MRNVAIFDSSGKILSITTQPDIGDVAESLDWLDDGLHITLVPSNTDINLYSVDTETKKLILKPMPELIPPTEAEIIASLTAATQAKLDSEARTHNYDGILSLCSYATSLDPIFKAEGQAGVEWRDAVWRTSNQIMAEVKAGTRPVPTSEELLAELPGMVWA